MKTYLNFIVYKTQHKLILKYLQTSVAELYCISVSHPQVLGSDPSQP